MLLESPESELIEPLFHPDWVEDTYTFERVTLTRSALLVDGVAVNPNNNPWVRILLDMRNGLQLFQPFVKVLARWPEGFPPLDIIVSPNGEIVSQTEQIRNAA